MNEFWKSFFSHPNGQIQATMILVLALSIFFIAFGTIFKKLDYKKKTPLWASLFVWLVDVVNGFTRNNIGKRWRQYSPWFLTIIILMFFSNISGIFLLDSPTSYILVTASFALLTFLVIQITAITSNGIKGYLKGFCDPFPLMLPMNIVSEISLPLSLAVRLFGNIVSGTCLSILIKEAATVWLDGYWIIPVLPAFNAIFDIAFGLIQTVVFIMLTMIFTAGKVSEEELIY